MHHLRTALTIRIARGSMFASAALFAALTSLANANALRAQSLTQRVAGQDGVVDVVFPSRPTVCGDGASMIGNLFGESMVGSGSVTMRGSDRWSAGAACEHGPVRVSAS